jgi:hypothetical protein
MFRHHKSPQVNDDDSYSVILNGKPISVDSTLLDSNISEDSILQIVPTRERVVKYSNTIRIILADEIFRSGDKLSDSVSDLIQRLRTNEEAIVTNLLYCSRVLPKNQSLL